MKPEIEIPEIEGLPEGMEIDFSEFMPDSIITYMTLSFNSEASLYTESDTKESTAPGNASFESMDEHNSVQISMEIMGEEETSSIYRSAERENDIVQTTFMGQKFLVSEKPSEFTWKFHADKINYLGYECSKATTTDKDGLTHVVWYTSQIPTSIGPSEYKGLPGVILMVSTDDGNYQVKASHIDLTSSPEIKSPKGGKKVTAEEFEKIQDQKMKEMEKMYSGSGDGDNVIIIRN